MGKGNDFWLDDPEWEVLRRRVEKQPVSKNLKKQARPSKPKLRLPREELRPEVTKQVAEKEVVVNLKFRLPKIKAPNVKRFLRNANDRFYLLDRRHKALIGAGIFTIVAFGAFAVFKPEKQAPTNQPTDPKEQAEAEFNPLVPLSNFSDTSGQQSKPEFRYDHEKKVLGYASAYNGTQLTISQQKVPEDFKSNPAKLMSVAESMKATTQIDTQKGTAFVATDEKTKSQAAVFATDDVLVFIRANKSLDEDEWQTYINQLNPSK